jgi:hypothetical protein
MRRWFLSGAAAVAVAAVEAAAVAFEAAAEAVAFEAAEAGVIEAAAVMPEAGPGEVPGPVPPVA